MKHTKYMALYCVTNNGNKIVKIVVLGDLQSPARCIVTKNTYAFKIFTSELGLEDVAYEFFESEECTNSVTHYIGNEYTYVNFKRQFPDEYIDKKYSNPSTRIIKCSTVDGTKEERIYTNKFARYRTISRPEIYRTFTILSANELENDYTLLTILS